MDLFTTMCVMVIFGCVGWQFFMMTQRPDTYMKLREQDRQHKRDLLNSVGKHVAPTAIKMFVKFLKW